MLVICIAHVRAGGHNSLWLLDLAFLSTQKIVAPIMTTTVEGATSISPNQRLNLHIKASHVHFLFHHCAFILLLSIISFISLYSSTTRLSQFYGILFVSSLTIYIF